MSEVRFSAAAQSDPLDRPTLRKKVPATIFITSIGVVDSSGKMVAGTFFFTKRRDVPGVTVAVKLHLEARAEESGVGAESLPQKRGQRA
jgi:hypothetical protein